MSDERGTLNEQQREDWVKKLRYSRSFLSKLVLSDSSVKEYYAAVATKLLSYNKVKSRFNWSGVNFAFGRIPVAKVSFSGKTLCLYLAVAPDENTSVKYKSTDVGEKKAYRFTPSKLKIKSSGALKAALSLIEKMAGDLSFTEKSPLPEPVLAKNFPSDTFDNLLTRGLIRRIAETPRTVAAKAEEEDAAIPVAPAPESVAAIPLTFESESVSETPEDVKLSDVSEDIYEDTVKTAEDLISRHDEYAEILDTLKSGELAVNLSKKFMLKMIDETWVKAVEDSIPALDEVVRTPSHFIEETEEVLPIERTKKVSSRSLIHLSQHTDLISRIDSDNTVTPSKLLNVFREDSIMTYENKFVNTLLNRLLTFVTVRYNAAVKDGANEKVTAMDFTDTFVHGSVKGRIRLEIELTDTIGEDDKVKNYAVNTDLWKRVRKIYEIVRNYQSSELVLSMGKVFVRPPIMRTNPILKNKNLRQCLALWEFIESYDDEIGIIVDEKKEDVSEELLKQVYNGVAQQYLVFCRNVAAIREEENASVVPQELSTETAETEKVKPVFDYTRSASLEENEEPVPEDELLFAVEVALAADDIIEKELKEKERKAEEEKRKAQELEEQRQREEIERRAKEETESVEIPEPEEEKDEEETEDEITEYVSENNGVITRTLIRYRKSFAAKLSLAESDVKEYYSAIRNKLLSKDKVKLRKSFACDTFYSGRKTLAKVTIIGKTLRVYFALPPAEIPSKYFVKDVSEIKKYAETPAMMKVRSDRALKNALTLIDTLCVGFAYAKVKPRSVSAKDFPRRSIDKLVAMGLIKKIITTVTVSETGTVTESKTEQVSAEKVSEKNGFIKSRIIYQKSFAAKLSLASDTLKEYYSGIRNKLLSKNKVKLRTSFACDTFYSGRKNLAKVTIVGKTLRVYFALTPTEIPPKYFVKDVSEIKKYAETPAMMKVKSDRALKNALTLIDTLCVGFTDAKGEIRSVSAKDFPRRSIEKLVAMGLIKKIITAAPVQETDTETDTENAAETVSLRPARLPFKSVKSETETEEEDNAEVPAEKLSEKDLEKIKENAKNQLSEMKKSSEDGKEKAEDSPLKTTEKAEKAEVSDVPSAELETVKTTPVDMSDAGGDPLLPKKDVVESISETILELPEKEPAAETPAAENASTAQEEVPVGGDALKLKPITLADLENESDAGNNDETEEEFLRKENTPKRRQNIFSRIFRRKK